MANRQGNRHAMSVYLAGPLFTAAEREFNARLAARLEAAGYAVFLPQRDAPAATGEGYASRVFRADVEALKEATVVVAVCDGAQVDDGTAWEVGYAFARGIPVVGLRTDSRGSGPEERVNLMIQQSLTAMTGSINELLAKLNELRTSR